MHHAARVLRRWKLAVVDELASYKQTEVWDELVLVVSELHTSQDALAKALRLVAREYSLGYLLLVRGRPADTLRVAPPS